MKYDEIYELTIDTATPADVFNYLMSNLIESITHWDYFVGWNKAQDNIRPFEIDLNTLNYLVGKDNIEAEFRKLLIQQPSVARLIPLLLACHSQNFTIMTNYTNGIFQFENFSFNFTERIAPDQVDKILQFARETRLLEMFEAGKIKSVPDYVFGVEVGLDTNARKNRSGTRMEKIVDELITEISIRNSYPFMKQASPQRIKKEWGITITLDKANRDFDFAVKRDDTLYLLETNYYGGGGSKLKSTAGEYKQLYNFLTNQGHKFIWITDGVGWHSSKKALEEAFNHIDHMLNLKMVVSGLLQDILVRKL